MRLTKKHIGMMAEARLGSFRYVGRITTIYRGNVWLLATGRVGWNFLNDEIVRVWHDPAPGARA